MDVPYVVVDTILILANYQVFWGKYRFLFRYTERMGPDFQMDIFCGWQTLTKFALAAVPVPGDGEIGSIMTIWVTFDECLGS